MFAADTIFAVAGTFLLAGAVKGVIGGHARESFIQTNAHLPAYPNTLYQGHYN